MRTFCGHETDGGGDFDVSPAPHDQEEDSPPLGLTPDPEGRRRAPSELMFRPVGFWTLSVEASAPANRATLRRTDDPYPAQHGSKQIISRALL